MPETPNLASDQDMKIAANVLVASQQFQRLCLGLAKKGQGYEIKICGKGDSITISYTVHVGQVV